MGKKSFNLVIGCKFYEYICIFKIHNDIHFFCHKYTLKSHNINWEEEISFWLNCVCYGLPYYANFLEKDVSKLSWFKFKHGHP